jgi:hypothetical protein
MVCQQFEGDKPVDWAYTEMKRITDIYGDWGLAKVDFTLKKPGNILKVFVSGGPLAFDNLLIRPRDIDIYFPVGSDSSFVKNNYLINAY